MRSIWSERKAEPWKARPFVQKAQKDSPEKNKIILIF